MSLLCVYISLQHNQFPLAQAWQVALQRVAPHVPADAGLAVVGDNLRHGAEEAAEVVGVVLGEPGAARGVAADAETVLRVIGGDHAQEVARHLTRGEAEVL